MDDPLILIYAISAVLTTGGMLALHWFRDKFRTVTYLEVITAAVCGLFPVLNTAIALGGLMAVLMVVADRPIRRGH